MPRVHYAGIGSRSAPSGVLRVAEDGARMLREAGWTLRSGHAPGCDQAFEVGAGLAAEVFLPWPEFESGVPTVARHVEPWPAAWAYRMAAHFHPAWGRLGSGARALHARNCHEVLGVDLMDPVRFVVCWVPSGREGGTGQALRIARALSIPVFFLSRDRPVGEQVEAWCGAHDLR